MVRVADIALFPDTILHIVAQAQTTVTTSTDRVGVLHEVCQLMEARYPVTTLLRRIDGTTGHVALILHLEDPDTFGVTLRAALVMPAEHIAVVVTSISEMLTVASLNKLVVTTVDGSRHGSLGLSSLTHAEESLTGQDAGTVLIDAVLCLGLVDLRQVVHRIDQVGIDDSIHLGHGITGKVGTRLCLALSEQGHRSPQGHEHIIAVSTEELRLCLCGRIHIFSVNDDIRTVDDAVEGVPQLTDTTVLSIQRTVLIERHLYALCITRGTYVCSILPAAGKALLVAPTPEVGIFVMQTDDLCLDIGHICTIFREHLLVQIAVAAGSQSQGADS